MGAMASNATASDECDAPTFGSAGAVTLGIGCAIFYPDSQRDFEEANAAPLNPVPLEEDRIDDLRQLAQVPTLFSDVRIGQVAVHHAVTEAPRAGVLRV